MSDEHAVPGAAPPWRQAWSRVTGDALVRATVPGLLLVALGLAVFAGLLDGVQERDDLTALDRPVLSWLVDQRGETATTVLSAITFVTGPTVLPIIFVVACGLWALVRREWWRPLLLAGAMAGSTLLSLAIKGLVARPRPPIETMQVPGAETTASFPSGHTIGTATFLLVAGYLACRRRPTAGRIVTWAVAGAVGIAVVGLSRLYLGYHFLTDVLAAIALAVAITGVVTILDRWRAWRSERGHGGDLRPDEPLRPVD
jgi:membrane-associated phospholipid phosphatase